MVHKVANKSVKNRLLIFVLLFEWVLLDGSVA